MNIPLKIAMVTGTRAEFGLLVPLIRAIERNNQCTLQLIVTGMHLEEKFGNTVQEIENEGIAIADKIPIRLTGDSEYDIIKSTGIAMIGFAESLKQLKPDWLVVLGDRFETFAAAISAHLANIPVAHLHGGELTEGATDDAMRHAITKMSFLHFTAAEAYKQRVIQMGESPKRVFNTGAIGIDNFKNPDFLSKKELEESLNIKLGKKIALVTFHPVTLEKGGAIAEMKEMIKALDRQKDWQIIFTRPNADAGNQAINEVLENFQKLNPLRVSVFTSLGQLRYLSLMKLSAAVIGNSSSGIIEAPFCKVPSINIGNRQKGRLMAPSVIQVSPKAKKIADAMELCSNHEFIKKINKQKPIFGKGNTAEKILKAILKTGIPKQIVKSFHDLKPSH